MSTSGPFAAAIARDAADGANTAAQPDPVVPPESPQQQPQPRSILRRSKSAGSPLSDRTPSAGGSLSVPLVHPRYERKTRLNRAMAVSDNGTSLSTDEATGKSASELIQGRSLERLNVRQGPVTHSESISYRTYAMYRHGSHVHTQSVGYSSDGDLVLHRRDVSGSDGGAHFQRRVAGVEGAVCLNPRARPVDPLVNGEEPTGRWAKKLRRMPKYPGVRCPKNRKTRNRLINDHLAVPAMRKLYEAAHDDSDPEGLHEPAPPTFPQSTQTAWMYDTTEAGEQARLERIGVDVDASRAGKTAKGGVPKQKVLSQESAAFRFLQLQSRMKSELQHAMSTDYMPGFMADLEERIERLIEVDAQCTDGSAPTSIAVACRDGYGRLITHGVSAFYKVTSASETLSDGSRVTRVSLPKKRPAIPEQRLTSHLRGERPPNSTPSVAPKSPMMEPGGFESHEEAEQLRLMNRRKRFKKRTMRTGGAAHGPGGSAGQMTPPLAPIPF